MLKQFLLHHVSRQSSSSIRPSYYKKLVAAYTTTTSSNNNNGTTRQARVLDLILVRHGESEGNVARQLSLSGDHSLYEGEFLKRHSSLWRLTDKGRAQSRAAGSWIKQNFDINSFNRHYTSEYIRAMETAALLDFPKECNWFAEVFLRERDWGQLDLMSQEERIKKFSHELKRRDRDRFFWSPPGGESLANVAQRVDRFLTMLHRECPDEKAIVVCHGEVMWAFRLRLERMSQGRFTSLGYSNDKQDQINNGQILHYTRRNPYNPDEIFPTFEYFRSICPWDHTRSNNLHKNNGQEEYTKIVRNVYNTQSLLEESRRVKRLIPNHPKFVNTMDDEYIKHMKNNNDSIDAIDKLSVSLESNNNNNNNNIEKEKDMEDDLNKLDQFTDDRHAENELIREQSYSEIKDNFVSNNNHKKNIITKEEDNYNDLKIVERKIAPKDDDYYNNNNNKDYGDQNIISVSNVGILLKKSRYQSLTEKLILLNNNENDDEKTMDNILKDQGFNVELLKERHFVHEATIEHMLNVLEQRNIQYTVKRAERNVDNEFDLTTMDQFDCMIAAGGDGTFLKLASQIKSPDIPLVGINTDGKGSKGALCCYTMNNTTRTFDKLLHLVLKKQAFHWKMHKRLKVTLISPLGDAIEDLDHYALNEIFFAERDPSHPVSHALFLDGEDEGNYKKKLSSGLLACTGTGSTAWMSNAAMIHPEVVKRVLDEAGMLDIDKGSIYNISHNLNDAHTFDSDSPYIQYLVREPVVNKLYKPLYEGRHGWCNAMTVLSLGWDTTLTLDGIRSYDMPHGYKAKFELSKDATLRSIRLKQPLKV